MKFYCFLLWIALLFMGLASTASAEIYQYQDDDGNYYYTDDNADIPKNRLQEINVFDEVMTVDAEPSSPAEESIDAPDIGETASAEENESEQDAINPEIETRDMTADELDAEKDRLDRLHRELQAEEAELSGQFSQDMNRNQLNNYEQQLRDLNARIKEFNQQQNEFQLKVERYNAQIKSEQENPSE